MAFLTGLNDIGGCLHAYYPIWVSSDFPAQPKPPSLLQERTVFYILCPPSPRKIYIDPLSAFRPPLIHRIPPISVG